MSWLPGFIDNERININFERKKTPALYPLIDNINSHWLIIFIGIERLNPERESRPVWFGRAYVVYLANIMQGTTTA
jgi:hypothetical protein